MGAVRHFLFGVILACSLSTTFVAFAGDAEKLAAKEAYNRGLEAHKRGELKKAAEEFARADSLAPSAVALQAALDAAIDADDAVLGAELLERSKREPAPPSLASSITAAHLKFQGRAGRLRVHCPSGSTCLAKLDDRPVEVDTIAWATTGQHTVIVQVDGGDAQTKLVEVSAEQVIEVTPSTKPSTPPTATPAAIPVSAPTPGDDDTGNRLDPIKESGVAARLLLRGDRAHDPRCWRHDLLRHRHVEQTLGLRECWVLGAQLRDLR